MQLIYFLTFGEVGTVFGGDKLSSSDFLFKWRNSILEVRSDSFIFICKEYVCDLNIFRTKYKLLKKFT